jgi:low affinity Fe/Cu permease
VRTRSLFDRFAHWASHASGRPSAFVLAVAIVLAWLASGPVFKFSDTWQLVINTGTTIVTFLMVFLIQNTQNRDTVAIQLKLDELIRANKGARNNLLNLEDLTEEQLEKVKHAFVKLAEKAAGPPQELSEMAKDLSDAKEELLGARPRLRPPNRQAHR